LVGKRMEALAEAVPDAKQIAIITNPGHAGEQGELAASQVAAAKLGLNVEYLPFRDESGFESALSPALRARCQAIMVFPDAGMMRRSDLPRLPFRTRCRPRPDRPSLPGEAIY
jgi:ABC-type uncharacterized transport system substrate-binding protein